MQITLDNLDRFTEALRNRLEKEIREGSTVEFHTKDHFPDPPMIEVEGQIYPYPAIGETVSLRIGVCPDIKF